MPAREYPVFCLGLQASKLLASDCIHPSCSWSSSFRPLFSLLKSLRLSACSFCRYNPVHIPMNSVFIIPATFCNLFLSQLCSMLDQLQYNQLCNLLWIPLGSISDQVQCSSFLASLSSISDQLIHSLVLQLISGSTRLDLESALMPLS